MSASSSPTICQVVFSPPSSSRSTVAPNTQSPSASSSFGSISCALASFDSMSPMRASIKPWRSRAASYSAFSDRSPCERASAIAWVTAGRSTPRSRCSSSRSCPAPFRVIGVFGMSGGYRGFGGRAPQFRVQVLEAVGLELREVLHAGARRLGARDGRVIRDAPRQRGGADRARVGGRGACGLNRVHDEAHLAVLDHVDDLRAALGYLVHLLHRDAVRS